MKPKWLFGAVLILCILFFMSGQSHGQQYSPEFQALLNQIQQNYLAPKGENIPYLRSQFPAVMAALIGHALRQQAVHVQQNPSLNNRFKNLQQEAWTYITDVARTTSFRHEDGSRFTPEVLWNVVNKVLQGQDDAWILQNFGVRTGTMPSVITSGLGPQEPSPILGAPPFVKESPPPSSHGNSIDLLGKQAPPVKGQPKTTPTPPPPRAQRKLNPDGVQGIWLSYFREKVAAQLKIWREGDTYLGMITQGGTFNGWKRNEVCFRIKYTGQEGEHLVFKGKNNERVGNPYNNNYEWKGYTVGYWVTYEGKEQFGCYWSSIPDRFERGH